MPVHDWTRVDDGTFHHFHTLWMGEISKRLNRGILPAGYYALAEQVAGQAEINEYTARQRSIIIRHVSNDRIIALIEILSPGNKASEYAFSQLLVKIGGALYHQIHLLLIDLHPPTARDPHGLHAAVWENLHAGTFVPPDDLSLTLVSYEAGLRPIAHVEPIAVGRPLPDMPLYLAPEWHVQVPLESTYLEAWQGVPDFIQQILTRE
jgi:hypothetical protein